MGDFHIGDRVETIDDTIKGTVVAVEGPEITIESDEGFPLRYAADELLKIADGNTLKVTNWEVARIKREKEPSGKKHRPKVPAKQRNAPAMVIDLHINKLLPSSKGMSNFDILDLQVATAKRQLDFAIGKRIQKVVFIHGVGEGVLKQELYTLFRRYDNIRFYDADYAQYGLGATEVYCYQNA